MAYANSQDMLERYDRRMLARLLFDGDLEKQDSDFSDSTVLQTALDDASGDVEAAIMFGGIYDQQAISNLTNSSLALLKRIVCDLAFCFLSRMKGADGTNSTQELQKSVESYLDRLRSGERLFMVNGDQSRQTAGQVQLEVPTVYELRMFNGLTQRAWGYFPCQAQRQNRFYM